MFGPSKSSVLSNARMFKIGHIVIGKRTVSKHESLWPTASKEGIITEDFSVAI